MAVRLSRRKIASYYADELVAGHNDIATRLAAFLIDTRRTRELNLIVRDIEGALEFKGILIADVESARDLSSAALSEITAFLRSNSGAKRIELRTSVDADLIGGVRIDTPDSVLDTTMKRKLTQLKASKL